MSLPSIPASLPDFLPYLASKSDIPAALQPYKDYDSKLREMFAQHRQSDVLNDPYVGILPLFTGHEQSVTIRARDLVRESDQEKENYLLPLADHDRKHDGCPAIVDSLKEFRSNFNIFSESSLVGLDWSNVVVSGSAVTTALLPVGPLHNESKRALRSYYHEKLAPAADVDLFIYGLDEEQAIAKIKAIETCVRDSILSETTTIRTKHAVTIVSQYPTRHVQIVLRLYKSISEILTGFDVDCSCVAYDGHQVWAAPRAVTAFVQQCNVVDLSRRSPSYENRLFKYSRRGFEVHWPLLDRSRIDPTIFERSFSRVKGLAKLLVYEKLPEPNDREDYLAKRRTERGRPRLPSYAWPRTVLIGNLKDEQPDDVADWLDEDPVSNYHTFAIPYGPKYSPRRIERLFFSKDLLLNAEWNRPKDRTTDLHRHPVFFGPMEDVLHDCCGFCPQPLTDEDLRVAEEESKTYISGLVSFIKDDPGRQEIGSFNPLTADDWTDMAYVGDTARLCQAIVDGNLQQVEAWCQGEGADVNRRDHTGRTPLQLATLSGTPAIVQHLIDRGARLVARMVDGFTALHIAACRGDASMVRSLLEKSETNEAEESARKGKTEKRVPSQVEKHGEKSQKRDSNQDEEEEEEEDDDDDDAAESADDLIDTDGSESIDSVTEGSFVKLPEPKKSLGIPDETDEEECDFYNIDVLAWDYPASPLHLAVMGGHVDVIELLVSDFGANVLLPIKTVQDYYHRLRSVILSLALPLELPPRKASETAATLLKLGASSTQADKQGITALQTVARSGMTEVLDTLFQHDRPAAERALSHLSIHKEWNVSEATFPLLDAVQRGHVSMAIKLLDLGSEHKISLENFAKACHNVGRDYPEDPAKMKNLFERTVDQPVIAAARKDLPELMLRLLHMGADINSLSAGIFSYSLDSSDRRYGRDKTILDIVQDNVLKLKEVITGETLNPELPAVLESDDVYLNGLDEGTYRYWLADHDLAQAKSLRSQQIEWYQKALKESWDKQRKNEHDTDTVAKLKIYQTAEAFLLDKGAKKFDEMYPDQPKEMSHNRYYPHRRANAEPQLFQEPYRTTYKLLVPGLTDATMEGYHTLFQAAWEGDVITIKSLTLREWGASQSPLRIAVKDHRGFSPFSIAVMRGHHELAATIFGIAAAQYQPVPKKERQVMILAPGEEDDSLSGSDADSQLDNVVSEVIDDEYTVEHIGEVANVTKSRTPPLELLQWQASFWMPLCPSMNPVEAKELLNMRASLHAQERRGGGPLENSWPQFHRLADKANDWQRCSPLAYLIAKNDVIGLRGLIRLHKDAKSRHVDDDKAAASLCSRSDLDLALRLGRTEMMAELISMTGALLPLDRLVATSGITTRGAPKYYQGLTVHGKKRNDWADKCRGVSSFSAQKTHSPLLSAALQGSKESVKFFMGNQPSRMYLDFASKNRDDKRIDTLYQADGGFVGVMKEWLETQSDLIIHMAVISTVTRKESTELLEFLMETAPEYIEARSTSGGTPLQTAFQLGCFPAAKLLVAAGANQATRKRNGQNLVHSLLGDTKNSSDEIRAFLALLEPSLVRHMLLERCVGTGVDSLTPMALCMRGDFTGDEERDICILEILLEYSQGADLEIMDGAGDYPLHFLVRAPRRPAYHLIEAIIKFRPSLLIKENATGQTPIDVVDNRMLGDQVRDTSSEGPRVDRVPKSWRIVHNAVETELCLADTSSTQPQRQLVSLHDAKEVAKRLTRQQREKRDEAEAEAGAGIGARRGDQQLDRVEEWMSSERGNRLSSYESSGIDDTLHARF